MNHNFADWEITQLLPKNLSEEAGYIWYKCTERYANKTKLYDNYICLKDETYVHSFDVNCIELRDAWTWEDIRLYLLKYNLLFHVNIYSINKNNDKIYNYDVEIINKGYLMLNPQMVDNYEQARKEAIIYCLKLINNKNEI